MIEKCLVKMYLHLKKRSRVVVEYASVWTISGIVRGQKSEKEWRIIMSGPCIVQKPLTLAPLKRTPTWSDSNGLGAFPENSELHVWKFSKCIHTSWIFTFTSPETRTMVHRYNMGTYYMSHYYNGEIESRREGRSW